MGTSRFQKLDSYLEESELDAYILDADGDDSNQYFLSGYHAPDRFVTVYTPDERIILTSGLEYTRAKTESKATEVRKYPEFDYQEKIDSYGKSEAYVRVIVALLEEYGIQSVGFPPTFPAGTAHLLEEQGIEVTVDRDEHIENVRAVKSADEIEAMREVQSANEQAVARVEELLRKAEIKSDGNLEIDDQVLTSEKLRQEAEITLINNGCGMDNAIVACGADTARAHSSGGGPIEAHKPITVDIFPYSKETHYNGDMTRSFVKGEPAGDLFEWYTLTYEAYEAALDTVQAGVTGEEVHAAACEVYESEGYPTLRTDESTEDGFFHSTGHGVGLDIHEPPSVGISGEELQAGHVITIEPGLYEQGFGGVRIEDMIAVTEDGYENLTDYPTSFQLD